MTASPSENIERLRLELPEPAEPAFNYVPVVVHGGLVFVSGQLPKQGGEVRIRGQVASADGFYQQPRVVDAASELLTNIFGEHGRHARSAVGVT